MKIVSIGSHPDDVELGMGGTLAKHSSQGDDVQTILCTLGGVSGEPKEREEEARKAAAILGIRNIHILDYPVSKLNRPSAEFDQMIKKVIEKINPDRIYTHSPCDYHQVHVNVTQSVIKMARQVAQLLFYEVISSTTQEFVPNAYVDITNFIDLKIESVKAHKSQKNRFYLHPTVIRSLGNTRYVWGKVGPDFNGLAEAFRIHKMIVQ